MKLIVFKKSVTLWLKNKILADSLKLTLIHTIAYRMFRHSSCYNVRKCKIVKPNFDKKILFEKWLYSIEKNCSDKDEKS